MGWTMRRDGVDFEVLVGGGKRESLLLANGKQVDAQTADYWESSRLIHQDVTFEVRWGPRNTIIGCNLMEQPTGGKATRTPLTPPPGSKAAKQEAFARDHPNLFVLRRVGQAALEIVIGVLGFGALVSAFIGSLLPRLNFSWLPRPPLPAWLPDLSAPGWLRYLDIAHWLRQLGLSWPDVPTWVHAVLDEKKYWLPLVIAFFVALDQIQRRRAIDAKRAAAADGARAD